MQPVVDVELVVAAEERRRLFLDRLGRRVELDQSRHSRTKLEA